MTYQNDDARNAIRHIQELLRSLQIASGETVTVPIDGIYGTATSEAVRAFQAQNGLPVTGDVDRATYNLLYEKALEAEFLASEPLPLYIFPKGQSVKKGELSDFVLLLQILLNALTVAYDDFAPLELSGVFDDTMENAVRRFQMRNNLPATGIVNKATWNALVRNYNKFGNPHT